MTGTLAKGDLDLALLSATFCCDGGLVLLPLIEFRYLFHFYKNDTIIRDKI